MFLDRSWPIRGGAAIFIRNVTPCVVQIVRAPFSSHHVSSASDGLYLSPLSDMSPATSDCLETYFSGGFYFIFQLSHVC